MSSLLANGVPNEADETQRKSYVTYTFPVSSSIWGDRSVTTLESRAILSSSGTTGLRTWEAALHLGNYLSSIGWDHIRDKHVLELGAGTGVLSILCAKYLNARQVAATDGNEGIVSALRENIFVNGLEGDSRIESLVLRWASSLNETTFADESAFDVILGADVVREALPCQQFLPKSLACSVSPKNNGSLIKWRRRTTKTQSAPWSQR
jgi:predicted nicotinamide N-methyase